MSRAKAQRDREALARKLQELLERRVKDLQADAFDRIQDVLDSMRTDAEGRLDFTPGNLAAVRGVTLRLTSVTEPVNNFLRWIVDGVRRLLGLNTTYFRTFKDYPANTDERIAADVLLRLGYDVRTGSLLPGGWLASIADFTPVAQLVARDMAAAIASRTTLSDFRKQFRQVFTGDPATGGFGYLQRHFNTFTFDLFQQVDRETQFQYAEDLGLTYAVYSGTLKDTSRPFCRARVNHIYTRDEIEKWKDLEFQGKLKVGYNPIVHLGGYNCRHHLSWIDEADAKRLGKPINTYK